MAPAPGRGTVEIVLLTLVVFLLQWLAAAIGIGWDPFVLSAPLDHRPWTVVVSVYAHGGTGHLVTNLVGLILLGLIVERRAGRWRLHAFVLGTGMIAGISEVLVGGAIGPPPAVLGISGAVFALMGYVIGSNRVTEALAEGVSADRGVQLLAGLVVAGAITWMTRGERVALVAHFTGLVLGLVAGRVRLLRR